MPVQNESCRTSHRKILSPSYIIISAIPVHTLPPSSHISPLTIPLIRPLLVYTLITSLIGGLQMFDVPQVLTNGKGDPNGSTNTIIMYLNQHLYSKNYGTAGAISVLMFLLCAVLCVIIYFTLTQEDDP